ncbi:Transcriptional regulator ATRX homolog [Gryllus bimaculatus]|nr:Transcriptional regulator ATRX homolog [Gryllus bimaculatus]
MDSSPAITLPSDEELQTAVESENTYKDFKKQPKPKMRVIDTVKEELKYREKKTDVLEKESLSCTTCGKDLKIHLSSSNSSTILSHPVLGVLLCKSCAEFYGEGEFSVDEDGTDKYCRWCGQGGTLYLCSECNFGFCRNQREEGLTQANQGNRRYQVVTQKVQKKADIQKKKKRGSSSDTSELRKRKRSYSSPEESLGKKKKRENSEDTLGERNELNKHLYTREIDRNTTLDVKAAETLATSCKEQIEYFLKFLRAMTSEVKKVLKEEIIVENLVEYTGRKKLLKKVMLLEEMSCQSVSQVCENFILGYRKSFVSVTENNEQKDEKNSDSEKESPAQKEGCKPNENMEEKQNDEIIEKPKTKYAKPSVHQFSESDNSGEELCQSDVNKMEKNKSDSENSKEKLKNNSNDERVLDKNGNDNNDDESSSECSKSKSDTNDSKKHKNDELNEKHDNSEEEIENNDQELQSNSDISSQVLQSEDACGDKPKLCVERSENGHLTDSKIVDNEDQVSLKNKQKKIRNSDKSSNDLCEEKDIRNGENESEENNLVCDENEESNMKNNKEMQVSDKLKTQQTISKRKSVLESAEENSGSDDDSLTLTKHVEEKSKNSSGASTEPISCKENIDKKDETHVKDLNLLDKNNLGFPAGEEKENVIDVGSDEDVISDSGSEKQHKMNKSVANSEKLDSLKNSTEKNFLKDSVEEKDDLIAGETSNEKNSLSSCKDNLKDSKDDSADSEGENHDKKSTLSSHKDASSDSDRDNVGNTDEEILSNVATKSSPKDALSDGDNVGGNLDSCGQVLSGEESDRTDLKNETNSGSEADDHVDRNEKKSSLNETKKKKRNMKPKCNEDEEKKAMMALLASSSSDESHISFRKHRKPTASDMPKEKCGPLSSKSLAYQNFHRKNQSGVFSDASEGMKGESDKKLSSEGGESDESTEKLQKCSVVVKRLPDEIYEKYRNNCSSRDSQQKDSEKEEIKKLVNLKTLDNNLNKKIPTVDSDSEGDEDVNVKKKKVFRKHAKKNDDKKEKETLKDFHDKDELSSQSEHMDFSDNDGNEKGGLKGFLEELHKSRDKFAEELLLRSSDSDLDLISSNKTEKEKKKKESKVKMKEEPKVKEENEDDKENNASKKKGSEDSDENSDVLTISSDSPSSDSDDNLFKPSAKRKHKGSSGSDKSKKKSSASESDQSVKKKTKRRRIKKPASDSNTTPNKGRKNIRKVMKDDNVAEATRRAAKEEEERRKRIAEKQKLYNALYNLSEAQVETVDKLVLDFDAETKKELVQVDKNLVKKLKPHQVKGVKFMWDACFESLEMIKKSEGSGCILAHCMGLGKTLQVITLAHTLLNNRKTKIKTVLVVCPLSTVLNWVSEFSKWLDESEDNDIEVMDITRYKQMYERIGLLKHWHSKGGVLILSYSSYRTLTNPSIRRQKKKSIESLQATLVDPGPDLVICDEGHQLKNEESALSKAMSRLRTKRRIFVKPNLLGTKKEFKNRFINPINNGQYDNSTAHDVKVMKRRAHVLHKMLDSSVQRYDYSVLTPFLPPKFEYVLLVRLTDLQIKLYKYFLENLSFASPDGQKTKTARLFSDFQALQRIWTHPRVLLMNAERREKKDFIATSSDSSSSSGSDVEEVINKNDNKRRTRSAKKDDNGSESGKSEKDDDETEDKYGHRGEWWWQFISDDSQLDDIQQSGKIAMLFTILEECEKIGDKVLVFSQSLLSLDLIEFFLRKKDEESQNNDAKEKTSWCLGSDYFRLDGSSNAENRMAWCNCFNKEENYRARLFLISTPCRRAWNKPHCSKSSDNI